MLLENPIKSVFKKMNKKNKIAVIGLGYVGLPLAIEFSKKYKVKGFDIDAERIENLIQGIDSTREVNGVALKEALTNSKPIGLQLSKSEESLSGCNVYIITVPTPVDKNNRPILSPLIKASETVGRHLKKDDIVIYESTVYPGVTEDECVPILEQVSQLKFNHDFYCGYSPERINPGDKNRGVTDILKVTSGSTPEIGEKINELYSSVIKAGTHLAPSIKVAEASKVIENAQRDINIAFVNELAKIFNKLDIDTHAVLEAASTKWNFLPFKPGLVGGHCIGVDPFYLAQKAQEAGYYSELILTARRLNDSMGQYVADELLKHMVKKRIFLDNAKILMLGFAFKENCPDFRNTKAIDVYLALKGFNLDVSIYDPWVSKEDVKKEYGIELIDKLEHNYDAIIHVVAHAEFSELDINELKSPSSVVYDVKGNLNTKFITNRL